jgi:hypothetical protein
MGPTKCSISIIGNIMEKKDVWCGIHVHEPSSICSLCIFLLRFTIPQTSWIVEVLHIIWSPTSNSYQGKWYMVYPKSASQESVALPFPYYGTHSENPWFSILSNYSLWVPIWVVFHMFGYHMCNEMELLGIFTSSKHMEKLPFDPCLDHSPWETVVFYINGSFRNKNRRYLPLGLCISSDFL